MPSAIPLTPTWPFSPPKPNCRTILNWAGSDPFRQTVDLFHAAGLKVVAYNPLNHPFMDVHSDNPLYRDWMRYDAEGQPYITTPHGLDTVLMKDA